MSEPIAPAADAGFQYQNRVHEDETALSGMWLFLATEVLFFGGLVFVWTVYHALHQAGFATAAAHANLAIGSVNTVLLLTSSAVFTAGVNAAEQGRNRTVLVSCLVTSVLGVAFLILKGIEWRLDFREHLVPGPAFALPEPGAQLFYVIYFVATGLHAVHMLIGLGLVCWVAVRAWRHHYTRRHHTHVQVVGLYWSFVDIVWLSFYPLLYLAARP